MGFHKRARHLRPTTSTSLLSPPSAAVGPPGGDVNQQPPRKQHECLPSRKWMAAPGAELSPKDRILALENGLSALDERSTDAVQSRREAVRDQLPEELLPGDVAPQVAGVVKQSLNADLPSMVEGKVTDKS